MQSGSLQRLSRSVGWKTLQQGDQHPSSQERNRAQSSSLLEETISDSCLRGLQKAVSYRRAVTTVRNYWVSCTLPQIRQVLGHRRMLGMLMPLNVTSLGLTIIQRSDNRQMCPRTINTRQWENSDLTGIVSYFPKSSSKENFQFSLWDERVKSLLLYYLSTVPTLWCFSRIFFSCAQCHLYDSQHPGLPSRSFSNTLDNPKQLWNPSSGWEIFTTHALDSTAVGMQSLDERGSLFTLTLPLVLSASLPNRDPLSVVFIM